MNRNYNHEGDILLIVKTPEEALKVIIDHFSSDITDGFNNAETVSAIGALGRVLYNDIISNEDVPGFNRSTVDGYAVLSSDTFGCSESIPAVLNLAGEIMMGESSSAKLSPGTCVVVSTGGEIPESADSVVMLEFTEDYGSGMIGIQKPSAPGNNVIFKGDDVSAGSVVLKAGTLLTPHDIGILSALGFDPVNVRKKPVIGVISTGDELVPVSFAPKSGQIRDVNTPMLLAAVTRFGAEAKDFGIIKDDEAAIRTAVMSAVESCDIVLISGGSSAGARDMTALVIEAEGELLLHGIAMKPGKPTILGKIRGKPVFGLPGHPVAAYLVTELFVRPLIAELTGAVLKRLTTAARISEAISSNHGRAEYIAVRLTGGTAYPVRAKSGLIASLADVDGYICIKRDHEGLAAGDEVTVTYF